MKNNAIYCSDTCPFCQRAYQLLESRGIPFKKHYVKTPNDWDEVMEKTGRNTVPQVFINGTHIGGFDDLSDADASGKLDEILNQ
ncbi:glutaredoxin domain-containing protein [bacterium endosymbiont of Bathymodiolus sp. 5 South]|uniref:glutaredoxin domain-containing protein n=1 Tax=bacterium endosymbiont of Bathymodiolus sp. 5 South TaxID=1181670 RepID=UPI0010B311E4|nr:glutaredoxin domain-containing protein [bacterium endosymbiont of Bathymodiolus sp. 5 South]CAC9478153.1 Glutaredoxin 3 (Grx3) [uncultured Gammaproteobacteria bacterium]CAC9642838.1 Glutaredoxin 3 (Grx3) [uncultured Gammaproteobacteria bacterium]SHN90408.1 Glutaredoxin 3 (Grx3) [bacterium endosymbiont of Bathymodiolus sp. 5 South]SSC08991.1 Glutaredoxin 3 (Grx3) [bacterium endosymbiont of Bathymodiolus sp. 5 South]VVH55596.1 Glutaredoxin 3 (Grx3) [uncultured Gammaproteobacteria bacterium]